MDYYKIHKELKSFERSVRNEVYEKIVKDLEWEKTRHTREKINQKYQKGYMDGLNVAAKILRWGL